MSNYGAQNFLQSLRPGDPSIFLFGVPGTPAALVASPGGASRAANVVTFTTAAAHNFVIGQLLEAKGIGSVGGTQFGGFYIITAVPTTTTLTCKPISTGINTNQANDTGGGGNVISVAAEQPAAPQQSIAIALADTDQGSNKNVSLEVYFTGVPGAFEVDLMEADTDAAGTYQIANGGGAKVTAVNASNVGKLDVTNLVGKFVAANIASRTNAVGCVVKVSR